MARERNKEPRKMVDSKPLLLYKNGHLLSNNDLSAELGYHAATIGKWLAEGEMPEYVMEKLKEIQKPKGVELNGSA